jgi:hypothetical protein
MATLSLPVLSNKALFPKAALLVAAPTFNAPTPNEALVRPIFPAGKLFLLNATSTLVAAAVPRKLVPSTISVFPVVSQPEAPVAIRIHGPVAELK